MPGLLFGKRIDAVKLIATRRLERMVKKLKKLITVVVTAIAFLALVFSITYS